jgi:hypothetical protein
LTTLSPDEKAAGRLFRAASQEVLDKRNAEAPPDKLALVFWRVVRHVCPAAGGASIGITLREVYEPSPEYRACYCSKIEATDPDRDFPHRDCEGSRVVAPAGQFAWIWKEGRCSGRGCGLTARARTGRFVIATDRPAERERTLRDRQASAHPGDL